MSRKSDAEAQELLSAYLFNKPPTSSREEEGMSSLANGILMRVHPESDCVGRGFGCWVHSPTGRMASWPVHWREDTGSAERICEHGGKHPDFDDSAYRKWAGLRDLDAHSCDGCCVEEV